MNWHYIYITTNNINGKKYLGQRKCDLENMSKDRYMGSGTLLLKAIKKYGRNNFSKEIIYKCKGRKNIDQAEIDFMKEYNCLNNKDYWYNLSAGGQKWREVGHSELVSKTMKEFYSDPRNRVKSLASKLGISVDECILMKSRKELIKSFKRVRVVKAKEESKIKNDIEKQRRKEYFNSDEYKKQRHIKDMERAKKQSSSEEFKIKVAEGKRKALLKNPKLYSHDLKVDHKIILAKSRLKGDDNFIHHLFWDNNKTIGMCDDNFVHLMRRFLSISCNINLTEARIYTIHEGMKSMGIKCPINKLREYAIQNNRELKRGKKMTVVNYSEAARIAGVSRQMIGRLKKDHEDKKKMKRFFVFDPDNGKPGINIDDVEWKRYQKSTNYQRVNQEEEVLTTKLQPTNVDISNYVAKTDLQELLVTAFKRRTSLTKAEMKAVLQEIEREYEGME